MSEVRREADAEGQPVAVKVLDRELSARAAMRARWASTSPRLASFEHPNAVRLLGHAETDDGRLSVTLAWLETENLRVALRRDGPLTPAGAHAVLAPVARVIDELDLRGVTHADVKTGNVLLAGGAPVLAHSWLAFALDDPDTGRFLDPEQFGGTIDYVAPEVIEGRLPTLRSDVYGLGCTLFELVTRAVPFPRPEEDATLEAHLHEEPPSSGHAGIDAVVRRALAKDPAARHPTASDFAADLADAAKQESADPAR